jgi:acyl-coenzyme A synthetase/AMP-(fatty) acid ligase
MAGAAGYRALTMLPLLSGYRTGGVLAWREGRSLTVGRALSAARRLGAALPPGRYAINLCETLDRFLVATLAALLTRRTLVLPPTRLARTLAELRARYTDNVCLFDTTLDEDAQSIAIDAWIDAALREPEPTGDAWPAISANHAAAVLFTSGSTGTPRTHSKTWGELVGGATALMRSIAAPPADIAIVGTVPPQHMFGLEATVMLPLQSGTPVMTGRPAFAADLLDVLEEARECAPGGIWLMTTPLQLRAFHGEYQGLAGVANVIASTMPLDAELARAVERDWRAPVHEIYGCTEGGILGVRRPNVATKWTPAAGLAFAVAEDGSATVSGGHLHGTLALSDRLRSDGAGGFDLIGRADDLVKIGGKRGSLAALTHELLGLPGVEDGIVFLPDDAAPRVAALAVAPGRAADDLRRELAQRVDSAYLPRPLLLVDALPRNAAGKLPLPALREFLATVRRAAETDSARRTLIAQTTYPHAHPALPGHFPGRPIIPGVLLLASVEDVLRDAGLRVVECTKVKFLAPVLPDQTVSIRIDVEAHRAVRFEIFSSGQVFVSGNLRCTDMESAA